MIHMNSKVWFRGETGVAGRRTSTQSWSWADRAGEELGGAQFARVWKKAKSVAIASTVKRPQPWTTAGIVGRTKKRELRPVAATQNQGKENGGDRVTTGTAEQEQKRKRICLKIRTDQAVENVLDGKKIWIAWPNWDKNKFTWEARTGSTHCETDRIQARKILRRWNFSRALWQIRPALAQTERTI
jgi:hypothetical protein